MTLAWGAIVQLGSGIGIVLVSLALLILGRDSRAARAYAVVLLLWGSVHVTASQAVFPPDPGLGATWAAVHAYTIIALPFAIAYFALVYPTPPRWLPRGALAPFAFVAVAVIPLTAYVVDHSLFWDLSAYSSSTDPYYDTAIPKGPFVLFVRLIEVEAAIVAFALLWRHQHARSERQRFSMLVGGLGFFVPAACTCALLDFLFRLLAGDWLRGAPGSGLSGPVGFAFDVLLALQLALILGLVSTVVIVTLRTRGAPARRQLAAFLGFLFATVLSAVLVMVTLNGQDQVLGGYAAWGFWGLVGAGLVAYALLRRGVFDIDLRLKWTVRRTTLASFFVATFFVVSQLIESVATERLGYIVGAGAAGVLLFALRPLDRAATRLADRAMPRVAPTPEYQAFRKLDAYRAIVEELSPDGITAKERRALDALRRKLGIAINDAFAIEAQVLGGSGEETRGPSESSAGLNPLQMGEV